jgi:hypothetical protein
MDNTFSSKMGGVFYVKGETYGCESDEVRFDLWVKPRPSLRKPDDQARCPEETSPNVFGGKFSNFSFTSSNLASNQVDYTWTRTWSKPDGTTSSISGYEPKKSDTDPTYVDYRDYLDFADNTDGGSHFYQWTVTGKGNANGPANGCESEPATAFTLEAYPRPVTIIANPNTLAVCSGVKFDDISFTERNDIPST